MMKIFDAIIGMAALFAAGSANAAVLYDSMTGTTTGAGAPINTFQNAAMGSPLGDSFSIASGSWQINSITLPLFDVNAQSDGGSVLVYLMPAVSGGLPAHTGLTLNTGAMTLLGTILDSALPTSNVLAFSNPQVLTPSNLVLSPGRYWIELVGSTDVANGGTQNDGNQKPRWLTSQVYTNGSGVGQNGEFRSFGVLGNTNDISVVANAAGQAPYEMIISGTLQEGPAATPEPATMAILGAGLLCLGLSRRRRAKKDAA